MRLGNLTDRNCVLLLSRGSRHSYPLLARSFNYMGVTKGMATQIARFNQRNNRLSEVSVYNGVVYLAGVTAPDRSEDIYGQITQILKRIDDLLRLGGSSKAHILFAQIWLKSAADFAAMNEVWEAWVPQDSLPGRATVESRLAHPSILVEIQVQAAVG